ncbi:MAG: blue (type 1) copper domain protein [Acidimicrobiales bacterium]|nr:blue (type 1) copper domain protein [Acidimicrobiales bacterium]
MRRTVQRITLPVAALAVAAAALVPASAGAGAARAAKPVKKTVGIFDNYYDPVKETVPVGSTIVWKWPTDTGDSHDVQLGKGPRGVKKFASEIASTGYTYRQKLLKKGTYFIICSLHNEMTMTIVVR